MSTTSPSSPPKRPRLSLQINAIANGRSGRTSRYLAAAVDVKSPTAFNTLSNVYATAVDRSTPVQEKPPTAMLSGKPVLRLQTQDVAGKDRGAPTPYLGPYLDTPVTAQPISPAVSKEIFFPSAAMTATPPLSAQPPEQSGAQVFTFDTKAAEAAPAAPAAQNPKRRTTMPTSTTKLPYIHPRTLRSILRNSPLPPLSTKSPESPRRQSLRLQEKAARRVAYNSPLTQTITTSKYVKSHIDLLAEDTTPISPSTSSSDDGDTALDQAMAYAADNQTRDGGQTPGPFEEMRRRMANMQASTPVALSPTGGGIRKRSGRRREKKRRWVWTIGQDEDGEDGENTAAAGSQVDNNPTAPAAAPLAVSVPVLAIPSPRPRTRTQTQAAAKAAAAVAAAADPAQQPQVPLLAVPVPPIRTPPPIAISPPADEPSPAPASLPLQEQQQQPQSQPQTTRELTPVPPPMLSDGSSNRACHLSPESIRHLTPEPPSLPSEMGAIEPPTPSAASIASSQDSSVFERASGNGDGGADGDVEMSDASSLLSFDDGEQQHKYAAEEMDNDTEMDEGTPTVTARPVIGLGVGWVPWSDGGNRDVC
ncbi:hypothetical protein MMYC01_202098 [Madurella mycetomatis]|uniref:Uncharacterized protein n=1 Tax=Madurella mycetomatis TaxID=100816 RepID=A0A175WAQ5_9PEZI|nr:hypothetical protein MMYC01_202098 [Madurella mycetomatis]